MRATQNAFTGQQIDDDHECHFDSHHFWTSPTCRLVYASDSGTPVKRRHDLQDFLFPLFTIRNRAGSMPRKPLREKSPTTPVKEELFGADEVESVIPELARAQRAASDMAATSKKKEAAAAAITEHRYTEATRKNLPAAGDALGHVEDATPITYAYDPHRPPVLRFNEAITRQRGLLNEARHRPLTAKETAELAALLEAPQPWLEWTGKRETPDFAVEPVALHIHERVSAQAILKAVRREDIQRDLFAEGAQTAREARAYYQHDIAWANRLITGDSLQVMTSLANREALAGQVQMIYLDPPYGIKFSSNWQNEVGKRDVKDKDEDLTREPEMIRAYRDTWTLGVHSYLAYLKQRLIVARELLKDSGSVFVQISDDNLHRVRAVLDEVFGPENYIAQIQFQKTTSATNDFLPVVADSIIWYGRNRNQTAYHPLYQKKGLGESGADHYSSVQLKSGEIRPLSEGEKTGRDRLPDGARPFTSGDLTSASIGRAKGEGAACWFPVSSGGKKFTPNEKNRWKTNEEGIKRLSSAERILAQETAFRFQRFIDDFAAFGLHSLWTDVGGASDRVFVVQTATKIVERCMLMTTKPGDLVLDPTCGSGTTAYVAEQWGRRWITIDSSRVAVAIARQTAANRLLRHI